MRRKTRQRASIEAVFRRPGPRRSRARRLRAGGALGGPAGALRSLLLPRTRPRSPLRSRFQATRPRRSVPPVQAPRYFDLLLAGDYLRGPVLLRCPKQGAYARSCRPGTRSDRCPRRALGRARPGRLRRVGVWVEAHDAAPAQAALGDEPRRRPAPPVRRLRLPSLLPGLAGPGRRRAGDPRRAA